MKNRGVRGTVWIVVYLANMELFRRIIRCGLDLNIRKVKI